MNFSILSIESHIDIYPHESRWKSIFTITLLVQLFAQEPIIQLLGIYMVFLYGVFYNLSSYPPLLALYILRVFLNLSDYNGKHIYLPTSTTSLNEVSGIAGLYYITLGVGLTIASQLNA